MAMAPSAHRLFIYTQEDEVLPCCGFRWRNEPVITRRERKQGAAASAFQTLL